MTRRLITCVCLLLLNGCGESGPEVAAVSGKITMHNGPWPGPASATFAPVEAAGGLPMIPAQASLSADGSFTLDSTAGAGLVPGKYHVSVECWKVPPDESNPQGVSHVPEKYRNPATSGWELIVESGKPQTAVNFDVPSE